MTMNIEYTIEKNRGIPLRKYTVEKRPDCRQGDTTIALSITVYILGQYDLSSQLFSSSTVVIK